METNVLKVDETQGHCCLLEVQGLMLFLLCQSMLLYYSQFRVSFIFSLHYLKIVINLYLVMKLIELILFDLCFYCYKHVSDKRMLIDFFLDIRLVLYGMSHLFFILC